MGWVVNATPHPFYPRERDPVPTVQEAGWALGLGLTGAENLATPGIDPRTVQLLASRCTECAITYRGADKSLTRPRWKQANVSVRMAWISFGALPCRGGKKKTWWQLASRCCWNRPRPWHASELVSFLVRLRTYQHPRYMTCVFCFLKWCLFQR